MRLRSAPCEGAAALDAGGSVRGGAAWGSLELAEIGAPGVVSTGVWVRDGLHSMGKPHGVKAWLGETQGCECGCGVLAWVLAGMWHAGRCSAGN